MLYVYFIGKEENVDSFKICHRITKKTLYIQIHE